MSVDRLRRFFSKTVQEPEHSSGTSQPDTSLQPDPGAITEQTVSIAPEPQPANAPPIEPQIGNRITLPLLGSRPVAQHQQILFIGLAVSLILLGAVAVFALRSSDRVGQQLGAIGQSLMQSQRLAKSVTQALVGGAQAFHDVAESAGVLAKTSRGLKSGDSDLGLDAVDSAYQPDLEKIMPLVDRAEKNAATIVAQQKILTQIGAALRQVNKQSADLLDIAQSIGALKVQQGASPTEISAAGQLVMLTQRIGKSSTEFLSVDGVSAEAVFLLGKDLTSFKEMAQGLLQGSGELRLSAARDTQTRQQLEALIKLFEQTRTQASSVLGNLQSLVAAREAQASVVADSEPLRRSLEELQQKLSTRTGIGLGSGLTLLLAAVLAVLCALGLSTIQLKDGRSRA